MATKGDAGVTPMETRLALTTVTSVEPVTPATLALTVAFPTAIAETTPELVTVATLSSLFKGDHEVYLRSGATLRLSRRFKDALFARMPR